MARNTGHTSLNRSRRSTNPMEDYDRLPGELRLWLAHARLPWGVKSAVKAYRRAQAKCGSPRVALGELDSLEARLLAKDAPHVWGDAYPGMIQGDRS